MASITLLTLATDLARSAGSGQLLGWNSRHPLPLGSQSTGDSFEGSTLPGVSSGEDDQGRAFRQTVGQLLPLSLIGQE